MTAILTRKRFLELATPALCSIAARGQSADRLTARQLVERIQRHVGVPWQSSTVDTFKAGNPDTPLKGIATTMMATLDVIERAARSDKNMVITHEPTFYNHEDNTQSFAGDKVLAAKLDFIARNDMVVWRFHDHWHARRPDGITTGMAKALDWEKYRSQEGEGLYDLPPASLEQMARQVQNRLGIRIIRVVGDPAMKVRRIALRPGYSTLAATMRAFAQPDVDVLVIGEAREWEGVEYTQDLIAANHRKGLVILGHVMSEESGMRECAEWLKTFVTEVPIEFIAAGEPYWMRRS
ncbi:MAG: Nif3-like dinuclear metal center hexameric protein [Acidobacteriia bacterium]|nr:Nif3-like dinuclear metal center hexameric protein [Terriglobia bacterium]